MASIVERESLFDADRPTIAGVFKKRLAHGIPLQSDATISYVLGYAKEDVTIGDTQLQSPYNTYVSKGLPPGPIANPGKKALDAVLHSEDTDYLYFVADKDGHNHFSKTYEEHLAEVHKIYGNDTATSSNTEAAVQAGPMTWPWQRQSLTTITALKKRWKQILNMLMWNLRTNIHQQRFQLLKFQHQHQLHKHQLNLHQQLNHLALTLMCRLQHLLQNLCKMLYQVHNKYLILK